MKNFYRSNNTKIAGVCGGIAEYFNLDPVIIRVVFLAMLFSGILTWFSLFLYLALWISSSKKQ
ncbi:MAG: PspC domain-containing protein [Elusimicrobiales bacterium]|nr:PspC domain-containing protein [Elusimicrobiales bacterium]